MAAKTRSQLKTQSDNTFLDNSTGQIVPENHRIWNDDTIDSAAMVDDANTFTGGNTFEQTIISTVADGTDALFAADGNINLQGGDLDVGGETNLNTTFIRSLQNAFGNTTYSATNPTLDLSNAEGNIIYIEDDGQINSWLGVQGRIYHAIFTGNVWWNVTGGDVEPNANIRLFPSDTLTFIFVTSGTIRVLGIYRATNQIQNQLNGQNYFQINLPQDALDLQSTGQLAVGATYKVLSAFELPKYSGKFYDVFLRAETSDLFEPTCYIANIGNFDGILQKALFTGDFEPNSILITDNLDAANPISYDEAEINAGGGTQFMFAGAKAYIQDSAVGFYGDVTFANTTLKPIAQNLLDIQEKGVFGRIMNVAPPLSLPINGFVPHSAYGTAGALLFGNRWWNGLPSVATINTTFNSGFGSGITTITDYRLIYQVVNNVCTLSFWATLTATNSQGIDNKEFYAILPTPFLMGLNSTFGSGTLRFLSTSQNHSDQGLVVEEYQNAGGNYFLIKSRHNNVANNQSLQISGNITFEIVE